MRGIRAFALGLMLLATLAGGAWAQEEGRSYRIGDVHIAADLRPDGSMRVRETRQFVYRGTYRGAFYELPLRGGQQVTDFRLSDDTGVFYQPGEADDETPGSYVLEQGDAEFRVTWFYAEPATDGTRSFLLEYVVTGAGQRHEDAAELYWKWSGTGWDVPTDRVVADLALPPGSEALVAGEDLHIFGHGPLNGELSVPAPGVVRAQVTDLPANTFVEVRVLTPPELLADAPSTGRTVRDAILAEERCLGIAADADRARARGEQPAADCDPRAGARRVGSIAILATLALAGAAWAVLFRRHGREHPLPLGMSPVEQAPPTDDPPALVSVLRRWGSVDDQALVATVLDLARRGYIELRSDMRDGLDSGEVLVFRRRRDAEEPFEREVQRLLFELAGDGTEVTEDQLGAWVSANRSKAYAWWTAWSGQLKVAGQARGWFEPGRRAASAGLGVAVILISIGVGIVTGSLVAILGVIGGIVLLALTPLMRRRSEEGRLLHDRWQRFGDFLKTLDFRSTADRAPDALAQWGPSLVYAIPLGVAAEVARRLDLQLSDTEKERVAGGWYPYWYAGPHHHAGFAGGLDAVSSAVPSGAISSSPSSSGGGGGFSGGGGGGGGGSGGGAF